MNDLVQTTWGDAWEVNTGEQEECYIGLPTEVIASLEHRAFRIRSIVHAAAIEVGKDLAEAKKEIAPYKDGGFKGWVEKRARITEQYAYTLINTYEQFGETKVTLVSHFANESMRLLSAPSVPQEARNEALQRAESGEKISVKTAKEIIEAQQAQKQAEEQAQSAQQQLVQVRSIYQTQVRELNQRITALQEQIATISTPEVEIKKEDTPETLEKLERLRKQADELRQQRDNLSREAEELGEIARQASAQKEEREYGERIRKQWRTSCIDFKQAVLKILAHWPPMADTQVFEADDWAYHAEVRETAQRFLDECNRLTDRQEIIVDAVEA